jgi:hypothetical protein
LVSCSNLVVVVICEAADILVVSLVFLGERVLKLFLQHPSLHQMVLDCRRLERSWVVLPLLPNDTVYADLIIADTQVVVSFLEVAILG